jgi:hypothetical protein
MSIEEMNQRNLAERRHKKGECLTCGNRTHKIGLFGKRTALTIEGVCLYGRCLVCNPMEGYSKRPPNAPPLQPQLQQPIQSQAAPMQIAEPLVMRPLVAAGLPHLPTNFVIETDNRDEDVPDDNTMVSGITMDHRLIVGARNWNGEVVGDELYEDDSVEGDAWGSGGQGRPEPSVGGMDDMKPPQPRPSRLADGSLASKPNAVSSKHRPIVPPHRYNNQHDAMMDQIGFDIAQPLDVRPPKHQRQTSAPVMRSVDENESFSAGGILSRLRPTSPSTSSRGGSRGGESRRGGEEHRLSDTSLDQEVRFQLPMDLRGEEKAEIEPGSHRWDFGPQEYAVNDTALSPARLAPHSRPRLQSPDNVNDLMQSEGYGDSVFERDLRPGDRSQQFRRSQALEAEAQTLTSDLARGRSTGTLGTSRQGGSVWSNNNGPPLVDRSRRGLPDDDFTEGLGRGGRPQVNVRKPREASDSNRPNSSVSVDDIAEIIENLDQNNRVRGFQSLAELIMSNGQIAKSRISEHNGIQILVESMWSDMAKPSVMEAACELLFALTASSDCNPESDVLIGDSAEGAVDALLITMHTHINIESIQSSGCGTLHCLASASSTNALVPDGTLSGAVFMVVNAMDKHRQSQEVQEWGIRALYSQCMLSKHAESSKKNLTQSGDDGGVGMGVIQCAMEIAKSDLVTVELACRLYWSLAANDDVARTLMETPGAFHAILKGMERYHKKPEAAPMMEAAFGALTNLARVCENKKLFRESDVISRAIQTIQAFHYDEVLYVEACSLLGVLATEPQNMEVLLSSDAVNVIAKLIHQYDHNQMLQEEALLTLVCLTHGSEVAKQSLCSDSNTIGSIIRLMRDRSSTTIIKELACTLTGSLCVLRESAQIAVTQGAIDAVLALLRDYPKERKIHDSAFVTLRNITSQGTGVDLFLKFDTAKIILDAMSASTESVSSQLNACCLLWNICAKAKKDPSSLVDAGAIMQIVKAMQVHMESGEVLEMACGALWCLIDQSDSRKKELLGCGAIDAVTCSLVMHPNEPPTLEKACGLLANVCTSTHMAEAIADSHGISFVVEAITNNPGAMKLLELGTLVLRNMVLTNHEFAEDASNGISPIIQCMRDNPDAVGFQREACNTLWALAAQSEECKNKILTLDGVTVLMGALEHNSCVGDLQDAARGAINQLAQSGPRM